MRWIPFVFVLAAACDKVDPVGGDDTDPPDVDETDTVLDTYETGGLVGDTDTVDTIDTDVVDTLVVETGDTGDTASSGGGWGGTGGWGGSGWGGWDSGLDTSDSAWSPACAGITDPNEPNDSRATATATGITAGGGVYTGTQLPLEGARDDEDFFQLTVPAGCVVEASITFDHHVGDGAIELLDGNGTTVAGSDGFLNDVEAVAWGNTGSAAVDLWVDVSQYDDACLVYDLAIAVSCPASCGAADSDEPNGDTATATLTELDTGGEVYNRTDVPLQGPLYDRDYYRLSLPPGCGVVADVAYDPANGDVQAEVVEYGDVVDASSDTDGDEALTWFNHDAYAKDVFVDVFSEDGTCTVYDLDVEVTCGGLPPGLSAADCAHDPNEPNDDPVTATPTIVSGTGTYTGSDLGIDGRVAPSDDWFKVVVPPACALYAEIAFEASWADLDLAAYDSAQIELASSYTSDNAVEAIRWFSTASSDTEVWLNVYSASETSCSTYDILVDVYCPDPATLLTCGADAFEPNDTLVQATPTGLAQGGDAFEATDVEQAGWSAGDTDLYAAKVPAGCTITADLAFVDAIADIDLAIADAAGDTLAGSFASDVDSESTSYQNTTGVEQDVLVAVLPWDDACSLYDLEIEIVCPNP